MDISKYQIPKALRNCTIENSVVRFAFTSPFHRLYIQDQVVKAFKEAGFELEEYRAINERSLNPNDSNQKISFFSNGTLKFIVERQAISFNCVSSYPGWSKYNEFIHLALNAIPTEKLCFTEVDIRFISTYNLAIFDKLDGKVELNWFKDINGAEIRFPASGKDFMGLVRVTNLLLSNDGSSQKSFVDVEIRTHLREGTIEDAFNGCKMIHQEEKNHFFQLLSLDFVNELGPIY